MNILKQKFMMFKSYDIFLDYFNSNNIERNEALILIINSEIDKIIMILNKNKNLIFHYTNEIMKKKIIEFYI